jgi:hypothetical protein
MIGMIGFNVARGPVVPRSFGRVTRVSPNKKRAHQRRMDNPAAAHPQAPPLAESRD